MCGIAGFVGKGDSDVLSRMVRAINYRGPDNSGVWQKGPIGLAHARLSIIDLSEAGHQPMLSDDQNVSIVFNGEIYNFIELRAELESKGRRFKSKSDTEVIIQMYEAYGAGAFARLEGMFAFALYDARAQALYLVRDRFGEKPLYYTLRGDTLIFASEPKALFAHPSVLREISAEGLASFMLYDAPITPESIWRNVKKVPAAAYLEYRGGPVSMHAYWSPSFSERAVSFSDALEEADNLIRASIERQLVSDVPLGVFLSGGIDSSLIAAYAKEIAGEVHTFSIGFEEKSYDESPHARSVAQHLGTHHHERIVSAKEVRDTLAALIPKMDEPIADPAILPTHLLARFAREHVKVALSGDGGDELFLGYPTFFAEQLLAVYQHVPRLARRSFAALASSIPASHRYMSFDFKLRQFLRGAEEESLHAHQLWLSGFSPEEAREIVSKEFRGAVSDPRTRTNEIVAGLSDTPALARSSWWYARTLLDLYLTKADRASMYASLETRAPLLDRTIAEFAFALPTRHKLRWGRGKYLLRKLAERKLPRDMAWRGKHGFGLPVGAWLMNEWKPLLTDTLSRKSVMKAGLCDPQSVTRLVEEHLSGARNHRKKLWSLLTLHLWYGSWIQ